MEHGVFYRDALSMLRRSVMGKTLIPHCTLSSPPPPIPLRLEPPDLYLN